MTRKDHGRADARFNKPDSGKVERDAALKAVTDNMARLKALRLAREASEPPPPPAALKKARASQRSLEKRVPHWRNGWRASKAAGAGLKILCLSMIFFGKPVATFPDHAPCL